MPSSWSLGFCGLCGLRASHWPFRALSRPYSFDRHSHAYEGMRRDLGLSNCSLWPKIPQPVTLCILTFQGPRNLCFCI